jgi:hypothetical protein
LVQGYPLHELTVEGLTRSLSAFITRVENELASQGATPPAAPPEPPPRLSGLEALLRAGLFALQFLPEHAAPVMIILTDAIFQQGGSGIAEYDDAFMRLSRHDVVLAVVHLSRGTQAGTALGYVPDTEGLRVAVESTGGGILSFEELVTSRTAPSPASKQPLQPPVAVRSCCEQHVQKHP